MVARRGLILAGLVLGAIFSACGGGGSTSKSVEATAIAFRCPKSEFPRGSIGNRNANPHADEATVPGRPDKVLLCRYFGLNQGPRPEALAATRLVSAEEGGGAQLGKIVAEMNETRPFIEEAHSCPMDEAVAIYALFDYPGESPLIVDVRPGGCSSVTNGRAEGGYPDSTLFRRLEDLLPLPG